jgi:sodium transport system ATP-binding protein
MREVIRRLAASGSAVLFSSHIMQEVSALCDHIVVLNRGNVIASGTSDELLAASREHTLEAAFVRLIGSETR